MTEPITREKLDNRLDDILDDNCKFHFSDRLLRFTHFRFTNGRRDTKKNLMQLIDNYTDSQCEARMKVAEARVSTLAHLKHHADMTFGNVKQEIYVQLDRAERELATLQRPTEDKEE